MCGRYTVSTEDDFMEMREIIHDLPARLSKESPPALSIFGNDVYPSCSAPIINSKRELQIVKWGFNKWDGKGIIFNARRENIQSGKFFSPYLESGRCIVPASAYFEWLRINNKPTDKYRFYLPDKMPLYMAGIMKPNSEGNAEYVIITRPATDNISFIHNRMPLIFNENQGINWLKDSFQPKLLNSDDIKIEYEKIV